MKSILEVSKKKVLVIDGAMGTMLMKKGLSKGCTELLNVENPDAIKEIHKAYKDAGADIIITNTFG
ncbi:MAG: homocysteine S-methyltransferase family protein, partial [Nanoarchaeota archaeon]|nr:homocysteine S-methyltransferase family protein [Nanoarchaeota archaeon]